MTRCDGWCDQGIDQYHRCERVIFSGGAGADILFAFTSRSWAKNIESADVFGRSIEIAWRCNFNREIITPM